MTANVDVDDEGFEIERLPVDSDIRTFNDWTIHYKQSHILHSQCLNGGSCVGAKKEDKCILCLYCDILELPHLPDMVFPNNVLVLQHQTGSKIEFNALDALKCVSNGKQPLQVSCAEVWQESRSSTNLEQKVKSFDWTFTTDYKGTLSGFAVETTKQRIDIDKLREKEKILFYHELTLYEDELHDHGIASLSAKIRVMPSSFFLLLRYFLRVDNVMVKLNDTRLFHEFGCPYLLREYTSREAQIPELNVPLRMLTDPSALSPHLPLKSSQYEKITINDVQS